MYADTKQFSARTLKTCTIQDVALWCSGESKVLRYHDKLIVV